VNSRSPENLAVIVSNFATPGTNIIRYRLNNVIHVRINLTDPEAIDLRSLVPMIAGSPTVAILGNGVDGSNFLKEVSLSPPKNFDRLKLQAFNHLTATADP